MTTSSRSLSTVFSLINSDSNVQINLEDFVVGLPEYSPEYLNTKISIKPKLKTSLYGNFNFNYNRVQLEDIQQVIVESSNAPDVNRLFQQLNYQQLFFISVRRYGETDSVNLPGVLFPEDFVNITLPTIRLNETAEVKLKAIPNSYLFVGETVLKIVKTF